MERKLLFDTGKGCSVCGQTPVVNVSGTYWLCGECVSEKIGDGSAPVGAAGAERLLIEEHNAGCLAACGKTTAHQYVKDSRRCDSRRDCPDCPKYWMIDLAAAPRPEAPGWRLVPVEPTSAMIECGYRVNPAAISYDMVRTIYRAMLAAVEPPK